MKQASFSSAAIYYVTVIAAVALFFLLSKRWNCRRHRSPPSGPLALPIIGQLYLLKFPIHRALARISDRYGPILLLRFGSRRVLLVSSAAIAEECFTTNDVVFANRPPLLVTQNFGYIYADLGSAPYGSHWRNLRRIASSEVFSSARVAALSDIRAAELHSLVGRLFTNSRGGTIVTVDLKTAFTELMYNTATQMIVRKSYCGEGATVSAEEAQRFVRVIGEVFYVLSGPSPLEDYLPFVKWLGVNWFKKRMASLTTEMDELFQEMVDERRRIMEARCDGGGVVEEAEERKTIIDVMLELQHKDPKQYTDEIIKGMILDLITAGTRTSSGTMEWAMAVLLNHPSSIKKARDEIDQLVGHDRMIADSDLPKLRYLDNIIKETLRLFPAAPILLPHFSSRNCVVNGFHIPRGTMLIVNAYAMHRDPETWPNPNDFMPERFEVGNVGDGSSKSLPFGSGRRKCPGENLAMRMMALTLATLIQCFEWERAGEELVDLNEGEGITMPKAEPLVAKYTPRLAMVDVLLRLV